MRYEYKVVPAPTKPQKAPRVKGAEAKFAYGLETVMNTYAADGWEYQRADILPSEERRGLRASQTVYRTVLVFRRALEEAASEPETEAAPLFAVPDDISAPEPPAAPEMPDVAHQAYEPADVPEVSEVSEAEHISDAERRSNFSLVGPARRNQEATAPPLAAPHVTDETRSQTDPSDDGR